MHSAALIQNQKKIAIICDWNAVFCYNVLQLSAILSKKSCISFHPFCMAYGKCNICLGDIIFEAIFSKIIATLFGDLIKAALYMYSYSLLTYIRSTRQRAIAAGSGRCGLRSVRLLRVLRLCRLGTCLLRLGHADGNGYVRFRVRTRLFPIAILK